MSKVQFINIDQGTTEWFELRRGRITASVIKDIMGVRGLGKTADDLAMKIAYERETRFEIEKITTDDMERGNEREPIARALYADKFNVDVLDGGFYCLGNLGASPDGRIMLPDGALGLIEIKSPKYKNHLRVLRSGTYDPQYYGQMQFQLYVTGAKWVDFVSYCPEMPAGKELHVYRVYPDEKYQTTLRGRLDAMTVKIEEWADVLKAA